MFDIYCDAFFNLNNLLGIKYSFIGLVLFFVFIISFRLHNRDEYVNPKLSKFWSDLSIRERHGVIGTIFAYSLMLISGSPFLKFIQGFSFLQKPAKLFLSIEPLISLVIVTLVIGGVGIHGSKREYLNVLNCSVRVLIYVSVFSSLLVNQFSLCNHCNLLALIVVGILLFGLKLLSLNKPNIETPFNLFDAVTLYHELFPSRKAQADELCHIVQKSSSGGISICVTGAWGVGKTSLVQGACDKLRKKEMEFTDKNDQVVSKTDSETVNYEFIFIRALELDNLSSLFHYLFARIREILKSRGAYVGLGSEYQRLIASAGGIISNTEWPAVLEKKLFGSDDDYRSQRDRLESLMEKVLKKDKLIIVIDDIERCAPKKAQEFLYFLKEIATMKCCISIFITDDSNLPIPDCKKEDNPIFWDKFFNYRIIVNAISVQDSMKYIQANVRQVSSLLPYELDEPSKVYHELLEQLENKIIKYRKNNVSTKNNIEQPTNNIQDEENAKESKHLFYCITQLKNQLSRPRTMLKFCETYYDDYVNLVSFYKKANQLNQLQEYFNFLQLSTLLFFSSFLKVCYPNEVKTICTNGFFAYYRLIINSLEEPQKFLGKIVKIICPDDELNISDLFYKSQKQLRFLDTFFTCPQELPNIVNGFTTQEQEWFSALDKDDQKQIENNWMKMICAVIREYPLLRNGNEYLDKLICFAHSQVNAGKWPLIKAFHIFNITEIGIGFLFNQTEACIVPLISLFCHKFGDSSILKGATNRLEIIIQIFIPHFLQSISFPFKNILHYIDPQNEVYNYNFINDISANYKTLNNYLIDYLKTIQTTDVWKSQLQEYSDGLSGLNKLLEKSKIFLQEKKIWTYPDVQNMYECAVMALEELEALSFFQEKLHFAVKHVPNVKSDLSQAINNMEYTLQQVKIDEQKIQKDFRSLFNLVLPLERGAVCSEDLKRLHILVSKYYDLHLSCQQDTILFFRSKLLQLDD